jgi:hypothetical protein
LAAAQVSELMGSYRAERTRAAKWRPPEKVDFPTNRNFESLQAYLDTLEADGGGGYLQPQYDAAVETNAWGLPGLAFVNGEASHGHTAHYIQYGPPIEVKDPNLTITDACIYVTTAQASKVARCGLYGCDIDGQPTTLISDFGSLSLASTGLKTYSAGLSVTPGKGHFLLAFYSDGSTAQTRTWYHPAPTVDPTVTTLNYVSRYYASNATDYTAGLPSAGVAYDADSWNATGSASHVLLRWSTTTAAT